MPIYAYKCESCGHAKDVLQKMSDAPLTDCPACGAASFKKQLTAAGFQLKGSGWYATDFKGGGAAPAPAGDQSDSGSGITGESKAGESKGSDAKGGDSKSGAKTDAKTDAKSDVKTDAKTGAKAETKTPTSAASKPSDAAPGKAPAA